MSRLRVVYAMDQMQDVRLIEGYAERFDLTVLAPASCAERMLTWETSGAFARAIVAGGRALFPVRGARWLVRERDRYDVVLAQEELTAALASNLAGLVTRRPVILQLGRTTEEYYRCRRAEGARGPRYWAGMLAVKALVAFNERRCAAIGSSSEYIASKRRARLRRAIPAYGVDTEVFRPNPSRAEARRALGIAVEGPLVLWRSRLAPEKDPETFLRAVALLRAGGRPATALFVGAEYRDFLARARRHAVPVEARDAVHPLRELPLFYRAADVTVQTSRIEGLGISPLESMACEVPVVVSAVGGLPEVARRGEAGLVVPPGDARATADAIARLLDDPSLRDDLGRRGRAWVLERYAAPAAFDAWAALAADVVVQAVPR